MSIDRLPHPIYSGFWLIRYVAMVTAIAFGSVAWLFAAVVSFVPVEALALYQRTTYRDQLSEIWTWVLRRLQPDSASPLGWNLLAPVAAALEMGALYRLLTYGMASGWALAITLPGFVLLWLHWWRPQGIGSWWPKT